MSACAVPQRPPAIGLACRDHDALTFTPACPRRDKRSSQQSVFLSRLPHLASETPQAAYSPGSNPFAPRPDTRTPPGAAAAMKKSALPRAGSPAITTSADGAYYDIELTPGVRRLGGVWQQAGR